MPDDIKSSATILIIGMNPNIEQARFAFLNASQSLIQSNRLDEVVAATMKVLAHDPKFTEARFMLSFVFSKQGEWDSAVEQLELVVAAEPKRQEAHFALATSHKSAGDRSKAIRSFEDCRRLAPRQPTVLSELGSLYLAEGQAVPAIECLTQALAIQPNQVEWHHKLGLAYALNDQVSEARDRFKQVLIIDPKRTEARVHLVQQLVRQSDFGAAMTAIDDGLRIQPNAPALLVLKASALSQDGNSDLAEATYQKAMAIDPKAVESYAVWLQEQGRFDDSVRCLIDAIHLKPAQGLAYYRLTEAKRFEIDDLSLVEVTRPVFDDPSLTPEDRMFLCYALGKTHEKSGDFESAIHRFDEANALAYRAYNAGRPLDWKLERETTDRRIEIYSQQSLEDLRNAGSTSHQPIFIVGMIRSGTTLLDQILTCHPDVGAAGELKFWMSEADRLLVQNDRRLDGRQAKHLADRYLDCLLTASGGHPRVTDKMPLNYAYLGLIHKVFPNAKILHMRRNPLDTCLSIYSTHFGLGPRFAYDQSNIAFNYMEYLRLMDHWRMVLPPESLFEVQYEDLVSDRETVMRKVIGFLGLEWDDRCLHHEENESAIKTPSRWQARQPIYRSSIQKWKAYEPYLGGLNELKPLSS